MIIYHLVFVVVYHPNQLFRIWTYHLIQSAIGLVRRVRSRYTARRACSARRGGLGLLGRKSRNTEAPHFDYLFFATKVAEAIDAVSQLWSKGISFMLQAVIVMPEWTRHPLLAQRGRTWSPDREMPRMPVQGRS